MSGRPTNTSNAILTGMLASLLLLLPQPAPAANKVKVALMPITAGSNVDSNRFAWTQRLTGWALKRQPHMDLMSPSEVNKTLIHSGKQGPSAKDRARIKLVRKFLRKGKLLYRYKRYKLSLKALVIAEKLATKAQRWITDNNLMPALYIQTALNYMHLRNAKKARDYIMRAIRLDLEYEPPENQYPKQIINYYRVLQNWLKKRAQYSFVVKSVPPGAKVFFNFRYQGKAPVTIQEIPPGKHTLRLEQIGYQAWQRVANIDPKRLGNRKSIKASIVLKRDPKALTLDGIPIFTQGASIDPLILDKLEAIQKRLGVKYLYMMQVQKQAQYVLKFAIFKKGKRKIFYRNAPIGVNKSQHRRVVLHFAKQLNQEIAATFPKPRRAPPPRPIASTYRPPPRRTYRPPPRRVYRPPPRPVRRVRQPQRVTQTPPPVRRRRRVAAVIRKRRTPPPRRVASGPSPFYATWWFWTATIGGAAVITGVILWAALPGPPPSATLIITTAETD